MKEQTIYIGYAKSKIDGEIVEGIAVSKNPKDFTGEYHPIISEYGEGSFADLLFKLEKKMETKEVLRNGSK